MRLQTRIRVLGGFTTILILCATVSPVYAPPNFITTPGGLTQYLTQTAFEMEFPNLPLEDFEESTIAETGLGTFPGQLDSTTSNAYFSPGDIEHGLTIKTVNPQPDSPTNIFVAGGSYVTWGNTSKAVGTNYRAEDLSVEFTASNIFAAGMDLMFAQTASGTATIKIYGTGSVLLDTLTLTLSPVPVFFGISSPQQITKITVGRIDEYEMIDNIQFNRSFPWTMFLPALSKKPGSSTVTD